MSLAAEVLRHYLRRYQRAFIEDRSPRIIVLKSRRIGFSEAICILALLLAIETPYHDVYLCSTSYTNAKELLRRVGLWVDVLRLAGTPLQIRRRSGTIIELGNGSRIIPMPALKVRSRTGTVILDEFPFYPQDYDVWKAVSPVGETSGRFRLILIGTPFGASGAYYDVWADHKKIYRDWSRHKVDIYQAANQGFPVDVAKMRERYSEDVWLQEFCCQFLSDINQYFTYDLLRRSLYSEDDVEDGLLTHGRSYAGIDLGSRQDASIMAEGHDLTNNGFAVGLMHTIKAAGLAMDYSPQFTDITERLRLGDFCSVGVDGTGEGAQLAQDLVQEFGKRTIHPIVGDWSQVYSLIPEIRLLMEKRRFKLPNDPSVIQAFTKIQRIVTTSKDKKVTFTANRDAQGHADEFYGSLIAYYAKKRFKTPLGPLPKHVIR